MQPGIVVGRGDSSPVQQTKPVLELLDAKPVVTQQQLTLARWMSDRYISPLGTCLWLMLPPGIVGHRDVRVTLVNRDYTPTTATQNKVFDALANRKHPMRGEQIQRATKDKAWKRAVYQLRDADAVTVESMLTKPRVRPKRINVAKLAIPARHIPEYWRHLGKQSREAEALRYVVEDDVQTADELLQQPGIGVVTFEHLLDDKLLRIDEDDRLHTDITWETLDETILMLRGGQVDLDVLNLLAREGTAIDVSWVYAQTGAKLADLKRLEIMGLVELGEREVIRDSLTRVSFVPASTPRLTDAQRAVWATIRGMMQGFERVEEAPAPALPVHREGVGHDDSRLSDIMGTKIADRQSKSLSQIDDSSDVIPTYREFDHETSEYRQWRIDTDLWRVLRPIMRELRREQTPAEKRLWRVIRKRQVDGFKFRRQYPIERFIVDFYNSDARLIIEVDGPTHEYTQVEDQARQQFLELLDYTVLRFTNEQVYDDLDGVLLSITDMLNKLTTQSRNPTEKAQKQQVTVDEIPSLWTGRARGGANQIPAQPSGTTRAVSTTLLHGVTGSGKTEIYLRAIEYALAQGRQAIFLVPEIALTAQTVRRVMARFPGRVGIVHSRLSDGERYDTWRRARAGEIEVIVGTRSALFTPLPDIGLVFLDEEHDDSYKQSPPVLPPYYHARDVAEQMMQAGAGVLILGSATPDVGTFFRAQRGDITYLHLPRRIMGHRVTISEQEAQSGIQSRYQSDDDGSDAVHIDLPPVDVVDMRDELKAGNISIFSHAMQDALKQTLARGEQAILYLNRRGTSTYVFCRDCGYVAGCPRCDTPMTYHTTGAMMHCHHCGYSEPHPTVCPECSSKRIKFFGAGTQQVEEAVKNLFPNAISLRWDADTASKAGEHDLILQRFSSGSANVLIGTQMIAKGLDLPMVTLVGVVSADMGLSLPDYAAGERVFQLLTQVSGRAGRGLRGGRVILQTYQPEHYAIQAASMHDYAKFYAEEIAYRRELGNPPFRRLVRIIFRYEREVKARIEAENAAQLIFQRINDNDMMGTEMIGPVPCFFSKVNRMYRWQIILRGPNPARALRYDDFGRGWFVDVDPVDLL